MSGAWLWLLLLLIDPWRSADARWEERLNLLADDFVITARPSAGIRVQADWRPGSTGSERLLRLEGGTSFGRLAVRLDMSDGSTTAAAAGAIQVGGWEVVRGGTRGTAGSGLLVGSDRRAPVAGVLSAWSGASGRLDASVPREGASTILVLRRSVGTGPHLFRLRARNGATADGLVLPWRAGGLVVLAGPPGRGLEAAVGSRGSVLAWRAAAALFGRTGEPGTGVVLETAISGAQGPLRGSLGVWHRHGPSSPWGSSPPEAAGGRTTRVRAGVSLRPAPRTLLSAAGSSAWGSGALPVNLRTDDEYLLEVPLWGGTRLRIRSGSREETDHAPWSAPVRRVRRRTDLRVRSGNASFAREGGIQRRSTSGSEGSTGVWLGCSAVRLRLRFYMRISSARVVSGEPLYSFEPGPSAAWLLHRDSQTGTRLVLGVSDASDSWHLRLERDPGGPVRIWLAGRLGGGHSR